MSRVLKFGGVLVAVAILMATFQSVDFARVGQLLEDIGWGLGLVLIPYLLAMSCDTLGWRYAFVNLKRAVSYWDLLVVRLISEAVLMSITAGAIVSDSLTPFMLKKHSGVPGPEGLVAMAARKCLIFLADGVYVIMALVVGWTFLLAHSEEIVGVPYLLPLLGILSAAFLLTSSWVTAITLTRGSVAVKIHNLLLKLPSRRLNAMLQRFEKSFHETDKHFSESFGFTRSHFPRALTFYVGSWLLESVETWLILDLLGAGLDFWQVLTFEALLSLIRSIVFIVPAGLGVQDIGYVAFLQAYGVADPINVGAAFVLLKRTKEIIWILIGYSLLFLGQQKGDAVEKAATARALSGEVQDGTLPKVG